MGPAALHQALEGLASKRSGRLDDLEIEHEFPGIGRRTVLLAARRIEAGDAAPRRILLAIQNITDRKKYEEGLEFINVELEGRVQERTAAAAQLRELSFQLLQSEQKERERLAGVLHDNLQQLLVGAKMHLGMLQSKSKDAKQKAALDMVVDLLTQSLDVSRSLTAELSPSILYRGGLHEALPWLARQLQRQLGLSVEVQANAAVEVDAEGAVVLLFHAVRELWSMWPSIRE